MWRKVKSERKNPWLTREVQKTGWHGSLRLPLGYRDLQSSPPMLPRFFPRVRVVKWLKRCSKWCSDTFNMLQNLLPKERIDVTDFPYLSHLCSSMEACARAWPSNLESSSLYGLRSSMGSCARAWPFSKSTSFFTTSFIVGFKLHCWANASKIINLPPDCPFVVPKDFEQFLLFHFTQGSTDNNRVCIPFA